MDVNTDSDSDSLDEWNMDRPSRRPANPFHRVVMGIGLPEGGWVRIPDETLEELTEITFGPSRREILNMMRRGERADPGAYSDLQLYGTYQPAGGRAAVGAAPLGAAGPVDPANPRGSLHLEPFYIGGFYGAGLSAEARSRIPRVTASSEDEEALKDRSCSVCLQPLKAGKEITKLTCNTHHVFHSECIDGWLKTSTKCPDCRTHVAC